MIVISEGVNQDGYIRGGQERLLYQRGSRMIVISEGGQERLLYQRGSRKN